MGGLSAALVEARQRLLVVLIRVINIPSPPLHHFFFLDRVVVEATAPAAGFYGIHRPVSEQDFQALAFPWRSNRPFGQVAGPPGVGKTQPRAQGGVGNLGFSSGRLHTEIQESGLVYVSEFGLVLSVAFRELF